MKSLSIHLVLFFWSWCTAIVGIELLHDLLYKWVTSVQLVEILQSYMVFFALLCYSQSYYILMWKSPEHSAAFKEQLQILICSVGWDTSLTTKHPLEPSQRQSV